MAHRIISPTRAIRSGCSDTDSTTSVWYTITEEDAIPFSLDIDLEGGGELTAPYQEQGLELSQQQIHLDKLDTLQYQVEEEEIVFEGRRVTDKIDEEESDDEVESKLIPFVTTERGTGEIEETSWVINKLARLEETHDKQYGNNGWILGPQSSYNNYSLLGYDVQEESKTDDQSSDLEERPSSQSESSSESESSISFNISSIDSPGGASNDEYDFDDDDDDESESTDSAIVQLQHYQQQDDNDDSISISNCSSLSTSSSDKTSSSSEDDSSSLSSTSSSSSSDSSSSSSSGDYSLSSSDSSKMSSRSSVPRFSGEQEEFEDWHSEWYSYLAMKGLTAFCTVKKHADLPKPDVEQATWNKKQRKAVKYNEKVCALLQLAFKFNSDMETFIEKSIDARPAGVAVTTWSPVYPNGRHHLVLAQMYKKYRGQSLLDWVTLFRDQQQITMSDNDHPNVLFDKITTLK